MNILHSTKIPKFLLAMLALVSMALFVVAPSTEAQAQANNVYVCFNSTNGNVNFVDDLNKCPTTPGVQKKTFQRNQIGVCTTDVVSGFVIVPVDLDASGKPRVVNGQCLSEEDPQAPSYPFGPYYAFPSPPPVNTNTNNGNTNTQLPPSNQTPSTPAVPCDGEPGFHKLGPLCVPNSPFSSDSIAGGDNTDAKSLAVKIIKILLYFAAIVAVIMIIVGGYYVMTAAGNEAQATTGRKTLTNAIIGLAIVILAYIIVQAVINFLTK